MDPSIYSRRSKGTTKARLVLYYSYSQQQLLGIYSCSCSWTTWPDSIANPNARHCSPRYGTPAMPRPSAQGTVHATALGGPATTAHLQTKPLVGSCISNQKGLLECLCARPAPLPLPFFPLPVPLLENPLVRASCCRSCPETAETASPEECTSDPPAPPL